MFYLGMIAAMTRHLKSLRYMRRDFGWIHTLLEEAENERMHLLTAMELRCPGPIFKGMVVGAQGKCINFIIKKLIIEIGRNGDMQGLKTIEMIEF